MAAQGAIFALQLRKLQLLLQSWLDARKTAASPLTQVRQELLARVALLPVNPCALRCDPGAARSVACIASFDLTEADLLARAIGIPRE